MRGAWWLRDGYGSTGSEHARRAIDRATGDRNLVEHNKALFLAALRWPDGWHCRQSQMGMNAARKMVRLPGGDLRHW
jgi:hypothetical protein